MYGHSPAEGIGASELATRYIVHANDGVAVRLGADFLLDPVFEMGLEGKRREARTDCVEHGLMLRGRLRPIDVGRMACKALADGGLSGQRRGRARNSLVACKYLRKT